MQLTLDFTSSSKINTERLTGQNLRLYDYLMTGKSIHKFFSKETHPIALRGWVVYVFHPAKRELRIGFLNSRASDLINKHHVPIHKEYIKVVDLYGELVTVVEYSIRQENL